MFKLLDCLSLALSLDDKDFLRRHHAKELFNMSLIRYPSSDLRNLQDRELVRMPAHSDFGSLTLLFQDSTGGLEIADSATADTVSSAKFEEQGGRFIKVNPLFGTVVVNVGYLLMRWSNGRWKNTIHRVIDPSCFGENKTVDSSGFTDTQGGDSGVAGVTTVERYSIPLFASPDPETIVDALAGCWSDREPKKWKPINVGDYLRRKRRDVYS